MKRLKIVEKRRSVREYKNKLLTGYDRKYLNELIENIPTLLCDVSLEFIFVEDGEKANLELEGYAGYYGNMIEAPHYYVLLSDSNERCYKTAGYIGEWFILKATKEDIGSCWIEVKESNKVKEILEIDSPKEVVALIAIGYAKSGKKLSNIYSTSARGSLSALTDLGYPNINANFSKEPVSNRKPITEIVFLDEWGIVPDIEELEIRGLHEVFFYMRLAPSYANRQPWHFIIKGNEILLSIEKDEDITKTIQCIEAGIAMFYFEVAMHDIGLPGKWEISDSDIESNIFIPEGNKIVGRYTY